MILWTIQPYNLWEDFQKEKIFYTKKPLHLYDKEWSTFEWRMSYAWMIVQMRKRIGPAPKGIKWPVWAWFQYLDSTKRKPDLRYSEFKKHEKSVRIEIEIPDDEVLLSDYSLWHLPLNKGPIYKTMKEDKDFDRRLEEFIGIELHKYPSNKPYPEPFHSEMLKSWELIFEMKKFTRSKYCGVDTFKEKMIQATFWKFTIDQVRDFTVFGGKNEK